MSDRPEYPKDNFENLAKNCRKSGLQFMVDSAENRYSYHFNWLGRPIIQYPQDMVALQEIIWDVKPDLIIETGIAHGGSLVFSASMLALLEMCGEISVKNKVVGIDIDIRKPNLAALNAHPLRSRIELIEASSTDEKIVLKLKKMAEEYKKILVILDSNHTHEHVLQELELYTPLVTKGSYCVVFDTIIEDLPEDFFPNRPWNKEDNPKTAVREFLKNNDNFTQDRSIDNKLVITVAPEGFLKRIK
jgi:cephalosporin hydroxylase